MRKIIGENIKRARKIRKMSLNELSSRTGIHPSKIKIFERGDELIDHSSLQKIAASLHFDANFFFEIQDDNAPIIMLRRNKMPKRDQESVIALAIHKTRSPKDLVFVLNLSVLEPLEKIENLSEELARELGSNIGNDWLHPEKTLSSIFEENGIPIIKIPAETGLFRGLFVYREGVPIIVIPEMDFGDKETIDSISHELGHALFLNQELDQHKIEPVCDAFADGFSEKVAERKIKLGAFDFVERYSVEAWKRGEISAGRAGEMLGMSGVQFREIHINEI